MQKKAVIILAEGFEEIEAIAPIDILRRAGIDICVASLNPEQSLVTGAHCIQIQTEMSLDKVGTDFDVCIFPGGPGAKLLGESNLVKSLISTMFREDKIIAAICAAPALVLAPTGILDGKKATCYPTFEKNFSESTTFCNSKVVIDKNIITSRGPGTALDFSLAIVKKLTNENSTQILKEKLLAD